MKKINLEVLTILAENNLVGMDEAAATAQHNGASSTAAEADR